MKTVGSVTLNSCIEVYCQATTAVICIVGNMLVSIMEILW